MVSGRAGAVWWRRIARGRQGQDGGEASVGVEQVGGPRPVVDNGSSHNGQRSIDRLREAWPTARLVHLPIHASWLNQIEIVFSIIQRKVIKPADFDDLDALADRLHRFEDRYNETAAPFDWRFTTADLIAMLERVDTRARHDAALAA
jgi:hypothetical protein